MRFMVRRGQATVEFSLVFLVFVTIVFGAIEVARAIGMQNSLTRAAETIAHELAYTDPNLYSSPNSDQNLGNRSFTLNPTDPNAQAFVDLAVDDANTAANLNLSAPTYSSVTSGYYASDPNSNDCTGTSSAGTPNCDSVTSADGNVVIVGFPKLSTSTTNGTQEVRVTVCQPFTSVIGHFAFTSRRDGKACETVTATTLAALDPNS